MSGEVYGEILRIKRYTCGIELAANGLLVRLQISYAMSQKFLAVRSKPMLGYTFL